MWDRIVGLVGVSWGGYVLVGAVLRAGREGTSAFGGSQISGLVLAVLFIIAGVYFLLRGAGKKGQPARPGDPPTG